MTAPDDTQPQVTQEPAQEAPQQAHARPIAPDPSSPAATPEAAPSPVNESGGETVKDRIVQMLTTIYDPEIPVNIYEMGLIYDLDINPDGDVAIKMTLTAPTCPVAESLPPEVEAKVGSVEGVRSVKVELTWEPPWTPEKMSEAAKLELGYL
jgi:FeS assembly SUF system protein